MADFVKYNLNPLGNRAVDCVIRALSLLMRQTWDETYAGVCEMGYRLKDMPSANHVWGAYLRENGYRRHVIPNTCPYCYTVLDFCADHPRGRYLLCLDGHVVAVIDGKYYDTWDSGDGVPEYYFDEKEI